MEFSSNILPKDSAYYTLQNAQISDGILTIAPDGFARYEVTEKDIVNLTEYFRVALILNKVADRYNPDIQVYMHLGTEDNKHYNITLFPTDLNGDGVFLQEVQLKAGLYKEFIFEISSKKAVTISLWELCPEAQDGDVETIIEGVKQSLPRLLYDYNTWPLTIDNVEHSIALIGFNLLDHTDLQGHFEMSYTATEAAVLTIRIKDNEATELFTPVTYDIKPGRGSISIPHAYLDRLAGIHSCVVTAQVSDGLLNVDIRGILYTIDGGYLAERILDMGTDARDITLKHTQINSDPEEIWVVGIDAGEIIVRSRSYDGPNSAGFTPQYTLGRGKEACIEFDGDWKTSDNHIYNTLQTYEVPYIFFVDESDVLWVQLGEDEITRTQLATDVKQMSVCRAYKSLLISENDQGLICAYTKLDGSVAYRTYAYQGDSCYWLGEKILHERDAVHCNVHRLNDYRVGIVVTTNTDNIWYISDRVYIEDSVKSEHANYTVNNMCEVVPYPSTYQFDQTLTGTMQDDKRTILVTCNYPFKCLDPNNWVDYCRVFDVSMEHEIESVYMIDEYSFHVVLKKSTFATLTLEMQYKQFRYLYAKNWYKPLVSTTKVSNGLGVAEYAYYRATTTSRVSQQAIEYPVLKLLTADMAKYQVETGAQATMVPIRYPNTQVKHEVGSYHISQAGIQVAMQLVGEIPI